MHTVEISEIVIVAFFLEND